MGKGYRKIDSATPMNGRQTARSKYYRKMLESMIEEGPGIYEVEFDHEGERFDSIEKLHSHRSTAELIAKSKSMSGRLKVQTNDLKIYVTVYEHEE